MDVIAVGIEDLSYRFEPSEIHSVRNKVSLNMEFVCNVIFALETVLEILAKGLIMEKGTYLRSKWNFLNIVVIVARLRI